MFSPSLSNLKKCAYFSAHKYQEKPHRETTELKKNSRNIPKFDIIAIGS